MRNTKSTVLSLSVLLVAGSWSYAEELSFTRELDVIYNKEDGFALTMDKVAPTEKNNGAAIILVMSGGWFSNHDFTKPHDKDQLPDFSKPNATELLERGYTLFYVVHGTQPKFTIREIHGQISAAVRHIRHNAAKYKFAPARIGIMGASAGGHLALMQGTKGEERKANSEGPASESSKVQAVVAYFPPTDFVNYGNAGVFFDRVVREVLPDGKNPFLQALDYLEFDATNIRLTKVTDEERLAEHYKDIAPYYHVTKDDAPTLLLHGDADKLVPIQQSELIVARFKEVGVPHKLFLKRGGDHGWQPTTVETQMIANWFDKYLTKPATAQSNLVKTTVTYREVDGHKILADVYRPKGDTVRPVIVWIHGGALIMGHREGIHPQVRALAEDKGYALMSIDYRLAPETKLPKLISDVEAAFRWLANDGAKQFHLDRDRIVVTGGSAGGYLTLVTGFRVEPPPRRSSHCMATATWSGIGTPRLVPILATTLERSPTKKPRSKRTEPSSPMLAGERETAA